MPHRETSHKSSAINPIGPQPPLQQLGGKMPAPRGGQLGRLQSGLLEHKERCSCSSAPPIRATGARLLPTPIPFVASSPSKDQPKGPNMARGGVNSLFKNLQIN